MSVIIPRLFWKGIKCCARLVYLEVIAVPLRLIQLDKVGHDIHDQCLGACATLVYCQRHTPPGISFTAVMYWVLPHVLGTVFLKFTPTCTCKCNTAMDAPICPPTASQGCKNTLYTSNRMWDTVNGGLQPQPWHHNITQARPYPIFPKLRPHLHM